MREKVPLKEYVDTVQRSNRMLGLVTALGIMAVLATSMHGIAKATSIALDRNNEILGLHNDQIRKGERKEALYVTRGQIYAAVTTALVIIGLGITLYANFGT